MQPVFFFNPGGSNWLNLFVFRESTAAFNQLCETFPDENCVLTSREILVEVRTSMKDFVSLQAAKQTNPEVFHTKSPASFWLMPKIEIHCAALA